MDPASVPYILYTTQS